jgi:hypothetical protein
MNHEAILHNDHVNLFFEEINDEHFREELAVRIMSGELHGDKTNDWLSQIESRQSMGIPTTVMEYSAILHCLSTKKKKETDTLDIISRLADCRSNGFKDLTGKDAEGGDIQNWRLSKRFLRQANKDEILFHQAIYHSGTYRLFGAIRILYNDYIPKAKDPILVMLMITSCFVPSLFMVFIGMIFGYMFASLIEYMGHRFIAHADGRTLSSFNKYKSIGRQMINFHTEHSVHHGSVYSNYTDIFSPSDATKKEAYEEKMSNIEKVEKAVLRKGGEPLLHVLRKSQYGLTTSNYLRTMITNIPSSTLYALFSFYIAQTIGLQPGLLFLISIFLSSQVWIINSTIFHRYIHMKKKEALNEANGLMRIYLRSRFAGFVARSHRMHHTLDGRVNQNMTPFVDFLVGWSPIVPSDLADLRKRRTFY